MIISASLPEWVNIAQRELGVEEIPGSQSNPRVIEYHAVTTLKATNDDVAWCSSFVCWVMDQAGIPHTRSAQARSWETWGKPVKKPTHGCVVVFWRESPECGKGHVGFYMGETEDEILVLGGNQSNKVSIKRYSKKNLLCYRWPSTVKNSKDIAAAAVGTVAVVTPIAATAYTEAANTLPFDADQIEIVLRAIALIFGDEAAQLIATVVPVASFAWGIYSRTQKIKRAV